MMLLKTLEFIDRFDDEEPRKYGEGSFTAPQNQKHIEFETPREQANSMMPLAQKRDQAGRDISQYLW